MISQGIGVGIGGVGGLLVGLLSSLERRSGWRISRLLPVGLSPLAPLSTMHCTRLVKVFEMATVTAMMDC